MVSVRAALSRDWLFSRYFLERVDLPMGFALLS